MARSFKRYYVVSYDRSGERQSMNWYNNERSAITRAKNLSKTRVHSVTLVDTKTGKSTSYGIW